MDLTATLSSDGLDADLLTPVAQHLEDEAGIRHFQKYIGSVAHRQASMLDLVSPDADLQLAGVAAAYHVGAELTAVR
jgi:hypothetical protein